MLYQAILFLCSVTQFHITRYSVDVKISFTLPIFACVPICTYPCCSSAGFMCPLSYQISYCKCVCACVFVCLCVLCVCVCVCVCVFVCAGVLETGLFLNMAKSAYFGKPDGTLYVRHSPNKESNFRL